MEKLSLTKFIMSFFDGLAWIKTVRYFIGIVILLLICLFIYQKFFKKNNVQSTTFSGAVGEVNIVQKPSRFLIPFVEGAVGKDSDDGFDTSIKAGVRFEF